jgi:hypothetical protein
VLYNPGHKVAGKGGPNVKPKLHETLKKARSRCLYVHLLLFLPMHKKRAMKEP